MGEPLHRMHFSISFVNPMGRLLFLILCNSSSVYSRPEGSVLQETRPDHSLLSPGALMPKG